MNQKRTVIVENLHLNSLNIYYINASNLKGEKMEQYNLGKESGSSWEAYKEPYSYSEDETKFLDSCQEGIDLTGFDFDLETRTPDFYPFI